MLHPFVLKLGKIYVVLFFSLNIIFTKMIFWELGYIGTPIWFHIDGIHKSRKCLSYHESIEHSKYRRTICLKKLRLAQKAQNKPRWGWCTCFVLIQHAIAVITLMALWELVQWGTQIYSFHSYPGNNWEYVVLEQYIYVILILICKVCNTLWVLSFLFYTQSCLNETMCKQ